MNLILKIKYQWKDFLLNFRIFTLKSLVRYYWNRYITRIQLIKVRIKREGIKDHLITIRSKNRIDRDVIDYVFFKEYHVSSYCNPENLNLTIVDLGSNIGLTILHFKKHYPNAIIYGFEMDTDNYNLAIENCKHLTNVYLTNAAVWINKGMIKYNKRLYSDAYAIDATNEDNELAEKIKCLTIQNIIEDNKIESIDILKMDIEGAEIDILNEENLEWIYKVKYLNIEFHNISETELQSYKELIEKRGFVVAKNKKHWCSLEAVKI